jgi:creatinine amidohydrolase
MKKSTVLFAVLLMSSALLVAQPQRNLSVNPKDIVELELLTHTEVTEKIKQGNTSVLIITGGTEERGPHNVLGGHTIM